MQPMGISFSPFASREPGQSDQASGGSASPVQDAIRTLNLQVPRVTGSAPINAALLAGPGAAGLSSAPGLGGLDVFLRKLFGMLGQGAIPGGMPAQTPDFLGLPQPTRGLSGGGPPAPSFTPGLETGGGPAQTGPGAVGTTTGGSIPLVPKMPTPPASASPRPSLPTMPDWNTVPDYFQRDPAPSWDSPDWA
jgi:hypothetical protein